MNKQQLPPVPPQKQGLADMVQVELAKSLAPLVPKKPKITSRGPSFDRVPPHPLELWSKVYLAGLGRDLLMPEINADEAMARYEERLARFKP